MERASGVGTGPPRFSGFCLPTGGFTSAPGVSREGQLPLGRTVLSPVHKPRLVSDSRVRLRMDKPAPRPLCPRLRFTLSARVPHWASPLSPTQREALQRQCADSPYRHSSPEWGANLPLSLFQRENAPDDILANYSPSRMK